MTITKAEIITLAFTRNVSTEHILDADITVAVDRYVDEYVEGVTDASVIYDDYVKPVIAFGVAVDIFDRIAAEISDRGVVAMISEGAQIAPTDDKVKMKESLTRQLNTLIKLMVEQAYANDMEIYDYDMISTPESWASVGFTGNTKQGTL